MFPLLDVRETDQYGLHETNSHKKDQGNLRIISINSSKSHLWKIADKKITYNEGQLYRLIVE